MKPTIYLATPLGAASVHHGYLHGAMRAMRHFGGRLATGQVVGSFLPRNRDVLTRQFLETGASHMMCVDSDIGWQPEQVEQLLAVGEDFVAGCYCMKNEERSPTMKLLEECEVARAEYVPAGFLLLTRACILRMVAAFTELEYDFHGPVHALWSYSFQKGVSYSQEDVAFCRRWRSIGGVIWAHTGVWVTHYGDYGFRPGESEKA